ncbi:hypothetical protein [Sinomicrobium sp.]
MKSFKVNHYFLSVSLAFVVALGTVFLIDKFQKPPKHGLAFIDKFQKPPKHGLAFIDKFQKPPKHGVIA